MDGKKYKEMESPYHKREQGISNGAFKKNSKAVAPVAKDTNKTRRKETRARIIGETVSNVKPKSNLRKDMKKPIKDR